MSNVIDLSKVRETREHRRRLQSEGTGVVALITTSGKIAAFLGQPDDQTGDAVFVDEEDAWCGPLSFMREQATKLSQTPSALLMAVGGFHLQAVVL